MTSGEDQGARQHQILQRSSLWKSFFRCAWCALTLGLFLTGCGGNDKPDASKTASPSTTPPPASRQVGLELADRLYQEGDFEQAIQIYQVTSTQGDSAERDKALWTLAKVQYQRGLYGDAETTTQQFLGRPVSSDEKRWATLLLGMIEFAKGNAEKSERALNDYVRAGGPAIPYAQLRLADLAALRDDAERAMELAQTAIASSVPPHVADQARFAIARYQTSAGDISGALASYASLGTGAERRADRAEALWLAGDLAYSHGGPGVATDSLRNLVVGYPDQSRALEALDHPALAGVLSPTERAPVLFQQRLNDSAKEAYTALVADSDPSNDADAYYHLGILGERAGDYDEALAQYDAAIALLSAGANDTLLGQTLWDRATVYERFARTDEAVEGYASISDRSPASEHVQEGLFRAGVLRYQQGQLADASTLWQRLLAVHPDAEMQARAHFWLAKATDDRQIASQHRVAAVSAAPLDYYGLRCSAVLEARTAPADRALASPRPDWNAVERWLYSTFPSPSDSPSAPPTLLPNLDRALELLHAGLQREAHVEFEALLEEAASRGPEALYRLTKTLIDEGQTSLAARAGARLAALSDRPPAQVLQLAYPLPYMDLATQGADANGFSPLLLLALVRQESFYDASAASLAAATGLTQVIPSTGSDIAKALGDTGFTTADLLRPRVSLRYGAYYLGQQLKHFHGNVAAALAAYNGGQGNADRWLNSAGNDQDEFLETIDFPETRAYVELVLENYASYQYAYGLTAEPSLALP